MPSPLSQSRSGSIYLITLITVAAIVSMVLIGVSLRTASNTQSALIEEMAEGSMGVIDAGEIAFEHITTDPIWRVTAQSGTVFAPVTPNNGGNTMESTVVDSTTSLLPTYDTTSYRLTLKSSKGTTADTSQIDLLATQYDYLTYLQALPLKHYWPLNEHSNPTTAVDLNGNYDGTYQSPAVGGASYNEEGGPVPVFASANDQVQVPYGKDFISGNGSISLWMKLTNTDQWASSGVLGMLYKTGGYPSINLTVWKFELSAYVSNDGSFKLGNTITTSGKAVAPNTWHHVVMTWGSKGLFLYLDGTEQVKKTSVTESPGTAKANKGGEQPMHLGGGYSLLSKAENGFDGSVAHVAMFDKQLKASEVAALAAIKPDLRTYSIVPDTWQRLYDQ
jgi:archaellin